MDQKVVMTRSWKRSRSRQRLASECSKGKTVFRISISIYRRSRIVDMMSFERMTHTRGSKISDTYLAVADETQKVLRVFG